MMQVENRNIFVWIAIMFTAWLLFSGSFGAIFGVYGGLKIAGPIAVDFSESGDIGNLQSKADQRKTLENAVIKRMCEVNWWFWWPLLNSVAWFITSLFLGFMKVVKYNEGLVILTYLTSLVWRKKEWSPPDNVLIESFTILIALILVHFVSRWVCSKRIKT